MHVYKLKPYIEHESRFYLDVGVTFQYNLSVMVTEGRASLVPEQMPFVDMARPSLVF